MARHRCTFLCALALLLSSLGSAKAQEGAAHEPGNTRLYGGLWLGFGGEMETEADGPLGIRGNSTDDLITTVGGQLGADFVLHRYFALGGEFRIGAINTDRGDDADVDRSKLFDIDLKPRLRFALQRLPLEVYLTVPVGLTIPRLADDLTEVGEFDERVGWNLGVGAGATFFPIPSIGINLEPLWLMHWFKIDGPLGIDADISLRQFTLLTNVLVAF